MLTKLAQYLNQKRTNTEFKVRIIELDNSLMKVDKAVTTKKLNTNLTLEFGSTGPDVKNLQQALQSLGITPGPLDGKYGRQTKAAVIVFQNSVRIEPDGIAGPITLRSLQDVLNGNKDLKVSPTSNKTTDIKIKPKDIPNSANAEKIFEKFKEQGFNDIQSAAWVGCISGESGNNPNATGKEVNKKTGEQYLSHGLCQWNKGRFKNLQKFSRNKTGNSNGWKNNINLQIDFVLWELDNWENVMGRSINPLRLLKQSENSLEKSLYNLIAHFEKPASNEKAFKERLPYAKSALSNFGQTDI